MKTNLLIIATAKYINFLPKLIDSVEKYFKPTEEVVVHVFTNRVEACELLLSQYEIPIKIHEVEHKPWPHSTLKRCHFFKQHQKDLSADYLFYIDADTVITAHVSGEDILGDRVGTQHCGFVGQGTDYETRPESTTYVAPGEGKEYYGGGFWGFSQAEFWPFVDKMIEMIDMDEKNGLIPQWHDESALNKYFTLFPPTKILSPSYHWPEGGEGMRSRWKEQYPCKILLLLKNHEEVRS